MAISSMSEYVLEPFLRLNALLKELLSCSDKKDLDLKMKGQLIKSTDEQKQRETKDCT